MVQDINFDENDPPEHVLDATDKLLFGSIRGLVERALLCEGIAQARKVMMTKLMHIYPRLK